MERKEKQIEIFVDQAREIAEEWTRAEINGNDTHPEFTNKMYLVHQLARQVIAAEDDKPKKD